MYVPKRFQATSNQGIIEFLQKNSFATLVVNGIDGLAASHIPLHISHKEGDQFVLQGHVSTANELCQYFVGNHEFLAVFMHQHTYISSSWYKDANVPTWNYIAVHVYGKMTTMVGQELVDSLGKMVDKYEDDSRNDRFKMSHLSEKYMSAHLKGIVGFEMSMDRIEASYKLSQNRNDADYVNIIRELEAKGDEFSRMIAADMRKLR